MAATKGKNLRSMAVTTGMGKDVKDTSQLSGQVSQTKAWKEKNSTTQYETSAPDPGPLGGKGSR